MAPQTEFEVAHSHPLLDEILSTYREQLGTLWHGYRNHCLTVFNIIRARMQLTSEQETAVVIAAAFHDLALWSDDTFDYLDPSAARARVYCEQTGRAEMAPLVESMIQNHHKIFRGSLVGGDQLCLAFRDADWSAFTFGLIPFDRSSKPRKLIAATFPNAGFHIFLAKRTVRHLVSGGIFNPFPMMKF